MSLHHGVTGLRNNHFTESHIECLAWFLTSYQASLRFCFWVKLTSEHHNLVQYKSNKLVCSKKHCCTPILKYWFAVQCLAWAQLAVVCNCKHSHVTDYTNLKLLLSTFGPNDCIPIYIGRLVLVITRLVSLCQFLAKVGKPNKYRHQHANE